MTTYFTYEYGLDKEVYVATGGLIAHWFSHVFCRYFSKGGKVEQGLVVVMHDFYSYA